MTTAANQKEREEEHRHKQTVTVLVNRREVLFQIHQVTGLEIKQTAIEQGVSIQLDFVLFKVKGNGSLKQIGDDEIVALTKQSEFRAIAPDDNS